MVVMNSHHLVMTPKLKSVAGGRPGEYLTSGVGGSSFTQLDDMGNSLADNDGSEMQYE